MSMYAVKNDEGKWLGCEIYCDDPDWFDHGGFIWDTRSIAEENVKLYGGHMVELVEAPTKVVVSKEEADFLSGVSHDTCVSAAAQIRAHFNKNTWSKVCEDRLMRAYVNGWTVEKPKRWNVKVPHTTDELYWKRGNGNIGCVGAWQNDDEIVRNRAFTLAEIEHYGLGDCQKVWCDSDGE